MAMAARRLELAQLLRAVFPVHPVPTYPHQMGLDPVGETDEYAGFANRPWTEVEIEHFRGTGFDICPSIGFRLHDPPHLWNYYLPGFLTASLKDDPGFMTLDSVMWGLRELEVRVASKSGRDPWWGGTAHFEHYSREQMAAVVAYLQFMRHYGPSDPFDSEWEEADDRTLSRWEQAIGTS